jgi:hypothetical protein
VSTISVSRHQTQNSPNPQKKFALRVQRFLR